MNTLSASLARLSLSLHSFRGISSTPSQCSVFMKRQKKIDPEVAKQREIRRRKRLEKEIRQMQKHSKKPKPVDELTLDVKSAKNIGERYREPTVLTEEQIDERAVSLKQYASSRNELQKKDDAWVRDALRAQRKALQELKRIDPVLYEKAVEPVASPLLVVVQGPGLTPPIADYQSPDGDYIDTTRSWT
ncbi:Mitochondrial Ribosomal Protein Large [Trichostrongylus colubriformis]|uniref:Large ribosomal subunit protein mL40 n=1 Tax=Trichostrongylus colubriformis TaxID=6319 RepID=A0AAN8F9H2_TRICO